MNGEHNCSILRSLFTVYRVYSISFYRLSHDVFSRFTDTIHQVYNQPGHQKSDYRRYRYL